jgi:hypothetical protein
MVNTLYFINRLSITFIVKKTILFQILDHVDKHP